MAARFKIQKVKVLEMAEYRVFLRNIAFSTFLHLFQKNYFARCSKTRKIQTENSHFDKLFPLFLRRIREADPFAPDLSLLTLRARHVTVVTP